MSVRPSILALAQFRKQVFRTVFEGERFPIRTLAELAMIRLSAQIRSEPDWWLNYEDPRFRQKWKEEEMGTEHVWYTPESNFFSPGPWTQQVGHTTTNVTLSQREIDYVLDELDGYAKLREEETGIEVACFDSIWKSDTLIPSDLRDDLLHGVAELENVPDSRRDWHPHTNETVLDLVHPSLYPLVYGKTLVYSSPNPLTQTVVTLPPPLDPHHARSKRFQWLPTDFSISDDNSARALGYINNLHPSHKELYRTIESALSIFVPLFERVLTVLTNGLPHRIQTVYEEEKPANPVPPPGVPLEHYEEYWEDFEGWNGGPRVIFDPPELLSEGYIGGLENREEVYSLKGMKIQVIVKLVNIHLTPENQKYEGGTWHVEGVLNERIVSTGIYCYDQENITTSNLAFTMPVSEPNTSPEQYGYLKPLVTWGLDEGTSNMNQVVGSVVIKEQRCIAFPNLFLNRVSSFQLADPTRAGHSKILVFFLVDPSIYPIPSTTIVPPQQPPWYLDTLLGHAQSRTSYLHRLPLELLNLIAQEVVLDGISEEEAKELRLDFIEDRLDLTDELNETLFNDPFYPTF